MRYHLLWLCLTTVVNADVYRHLHFRNVSLPAPPVTTPPSSKPSSSASLVATRSLPGTVTTTVSRGETILPIVGVAMIVAGMTGGGFLALGPGAGQAVIPIAAGITIGVPAADAGGNLNEADIQHIDNEPDAQPSADPDRDPRETTPRPSATRTSKPTSVWSSTSTSAPASSAPAFAFFIYSSENMTPADAAALQADLEKHALPGTLEILGEDSTSSSFMYRLQCTDEAADQLESNSRVKIIVEDDVISDDESDIASEDATPKVAVKPEVGSNGILIDTGAAPDLKSLSQPPDLKDIDPFYLPGYAYPESAGKGITVYIIDTGANPGHEEYVESPGKKRWIYSPDLSMQTESDPDGHGSCMQSIINGPRTGVAKNADVVIVKLGKPFKISGVMSALVLVAEDIQANNLQGKAVVSASIGGPVVNITATERAGKTIFKDNFEPTVVAYRYFIQQILDLDVPVVFPSGNNRKKWDHIDEFPAWLSREIDIITVGGVTNSGLRTAFSQGTSDELTISAPGGVTCAGKSGQDTYTASIGTSVATPQVAGVIATWLGDEKYRERLHVPGRVVANVKALLKELQYVKADPSRPEGGLPVVYNGVDAFSCTTNTGGKRADGAACSIDRNITETESKLPATPPRPTGAAPSTFRTSTTVSSAPATVSSATVSPMYCYSFDPKWYGWCCPDEPGGTCSSEFPGKQGCRCGAGGMTNVVPDAARCPMF